MSSTRTSATGTWTSRPARYRPLLPMTPRDPNARRVGRTRTAGFTLIEVMVVTIIISVIVASVLFSVDLTGNQKTRSAVSGVQVLMQGLSNEAILEGNHYGIKWERKAQKFVPVVANANGWSAYSNATGDRPDFKSVSWKGFADVAITVGGAFFDERIKDNENFYAGRDQEQGGNGPLVEFRPTGLWEPAGKLQFFVGKKLYATIEWTAAGRMQLAYGDNP